MKTGTLKATAIRVAEIDISFMDSSVKFDAKIAFVNPESGATHSWTTHRSWSGPTLSKLRELRESMEADVAAAHFVGGGGATETQGVTAPVSSQAPQGIGEMLGALHKDADQID